MIENCLYLQMLKRYFRKGLINDNFTYQLISELKSTKNSCCVDIKAVFTAGSKTVIKFG